MTTGKKKPTGQQSVVMLLYENVIIAWFGLESTFKGHLVPTPLPRAGISSTRPGCSKPHPT